MGCPISRRDFLNGIAVSAGGALAGESLLAAVAMGGEQSAPEKTAGYYPPALTGMRGNHDGSFTLAHRLRDGGKWDASGPAAKSGETYDLVVVGGGISGLAAAYFYRKRTGSGARILVLDNHDDFGGHAKRNEFTAANRMLLSYGGTQSIESPGSYSPAAKDLLVELGIHVERFFKDYDPNLYKKMGTAAFFDKETFGQDRLLTGMNATPWPEFLANAPLSDVVRRDIARVYTEKVDYMPGLSIEKKRAKLATISYADYLTKYCKLSPEALPFFQTFPHDLFGVGIDAVSAAACYASPDDYESFTYPGFDGLGFPEPEKEEPYIFHFPDGNASVARLLVRALIPGAVPGGTMEDVVTARADYSKLDQADANVRMRLNSSVVNVRHAEVAANSPKEVEVSYMRGGKLQSVHGKSCVLACYGMMIPYLCPELPAAQQAALHRLVKTPLVYTSVALRNWEAFSKLKVSRVYAPAGYHSSFRLNWNVAMGKYRSPTSPSEPILVHMTRTPCKPDVGLSEHEQNKAGRTELLETSFATFERNIREQLGRTLAGGGFDPARDIQAITVNRWPHGYAPEYNPLFDPDVPEDQRPNVLGRAKLGNIAIANSDAGGAAYTDSAIVQADRAVNELLKG